MLLSAYPKIKDEMLCTLNRNELKTKRLFDSLEKELPIEILYNIYTFCDLDERRQLREYIRVVRLEARRWGVTCQVNLDNIDYESKSSSNFNEYNGFQVSCLEDNSNINALVPKINNSIFQIMNKNFLITPNGRISSDKPIIIVIGSKYYSSGTKLVNCLVIQSPTGHIIKGKFQEYGWITRKMKTSQLDANETLNVDQCKFS